MENKFARFLRNSGPARFFVPLGIILIAVGIFLMTHNTDSYLETVGKVTQVQEDLDAENNEVYDVVFTYTVNGKEYTGTFEDLADAYKAGDEIAVFYNPENPDEITNGRLGGLVAPIMIGVGVLALVFGVFRTVKAFRKSKELDQVPRASAAAFEGFKQTPGVTEYYCRYDGATLKPGYILEDAARKVLFEGKMTKQAMIGARTYSFIDHTTGRTVEHEVGHTVTQTYNDNGWSASSWFKFDGQNVWDLLHARGLRLQTNMRSKFPNVTYEISSGGLPFAVIETSGKYVHEDEAAEHKMNVPIGRFYYRVWTNTRDFETLFLTIFTISETEQMIVE